MKSGHTKYRCAKCDNIFSDYWYNYYQFNNGSFVKCPSCETKLVINFDYRNAAKLSDFCLVLAAIIVCISLVSMLFFPFKSVGIYVLIVGSIILLPLFYIEDYIRAPEVFPFIKKTIELNPKNDS